MNPPGKILDGYGRNYAATRDGRIWSKPRRGTAGGYLKPGLNVRTGYLLVNLHWSSRHASIPVHHLVARAFHGPRPTGLDICHRDGNRLNNAANNLEYGTRSKNRLDCVAHGTDHNASKTMCNEGHPFTEENTYRPPSDPTRRQCKECKRTRCRLAARRRRALDAA